MICDQYIATLYIPEHDGMHSFLQDHPVSNVWTVAAPYILLYYIVSRFMWSQISSTMYFSLAPWDIWPFLWCALTSDCVSRYHQELRRAMILPCFTV